MKPNNIATTFGAILQQNNALRQKNQELQRKVAIVANDANNLLMQQNARIQAQLRNVRNVSQNQVKTLPPSVSNAPTNTALSGGSLTTTAAFQNLMNAFNKLKGMPYRFGATGNGAIDCSAFTQKMMAAGGVNVPRTAREQFESTKNNLVCRDYEPSKMRPGDMIFFNGTQKGLGPGIASHAAIYIGNGKIIHAGSKSGVSVLDLSKGYMRGQWLGVTRPSHGFVQQSFSQSINPLNGTYAQQNAYGTNYNNTKNNLQNVGKPNFASMQPQQVYDKIKVIAQGLGDKHPEITAAQFCLESGYGKKTSGKFNYFGVKGKGSVVMTKEEIGGKKVSMKQSFKDYSSPIESIKDHIRLKMTSKHYTGYSTASSTDQALSCLKAYATGSSYLSDVKKLITRYNRTTARV